MPTDSGENRRPAKQNGGGGGGGLPQPPPEQEHLPCPRCDSTNTKFCYYNNYNFSQPRHFCKSCRRYWTHGGTLRDIPVGGGSRKNAKRSRTCSSYYTASAVTSAGISSDPLPATPVLMSLAGGNGYGSGGMQFGGDLKGSNVNVYGGRSFTSLLNSTQGGPGFLALGGGFGLGLGNGLHDMGFGVGKAVWPFTEIGFVSATGGGGNGNGNDNNNGNNGVVGSVNAWQSESGGGGFVEGDCFSWPAISTPGNGLK